MKRNVIFCVLSITLFFSSCQQVSYKNEEFSVETMALLEGLQPKMMETGQFRIYYAPDSKAAEVVAEAAQIIELSKAKVLALLQQPSYDESLNFLLVDHEEQVAELTDLARREYTIPDERFAIIVMDGEREPYFTRSLFKTIATHFWGVPDDLLMFEGAAVFAQGSCLPIKDPLYQIAAIGRQKGETCSFQQLVTQYKVCAEEYPLTTSMYAGVVFQLIFDGFGLSRTQKIWSNGIRKIERIVGMTLTDLNQELEYVFNNVTIDPTIDINELNQNGCQ
ncbi:MAG: hypothetical protein HRU40_12990 [Saprospiraceae bacterium]|nr:hypothetical protein [Saprospiraceae bacterium]